MRVRWGWCRALFQVCAHGSSTHHHSSAGHAKACLPQRSACRCLVLGALPVPLPVVGVVEMCGLSAWERSVSFAVERNYVIFSDQQPYLARSLCAAWACLSGWPGDACLFVCHCMLSVVATLWCVVPYVAISKHRACALLAVSDALNVGRGLALVPSSPCALAA